MNCCMYFVVDAVVPRISCKHLVVVLGMHKMNSTYCVAEIVCGVFFSRSGCSPVQGYEDMVKTVLREAEDSGVKITTCADVFMSIYEHLRHPHPTTAVIDSGEGTSVEGDIKEIMLRIERLLLEKSKNSRV